METTLLEADREEPEGSLTAQEKTYGVGGEYTALLTDTAIVTPEGLDSKILFGVDVIAYISTALTWLEIPQNVMPTISISKGVNFSGRLGN